MFIESFYSHLAADAGVDALVGAIYPHWVPQNATFPSISYRLQSDERQQLFDAVSSLKTALYEVDCWSLVHGGAHEIADAVESSLAGHTGAFGTLSPRDQVDQIRLERKLEFFETDTKLYRVSLQFFVAYY
jgi:hypothetical protein